MRKIAVFGGTFNPIHNGHLHLAESFAEILGVQKVLLIPARVPPHKPAVDLAPAEDRLAMCRAAAGGLFEASGIEIRRKGPSYTSDTLREIRDRCPDSELYLITGEDMFLTLEQWHEPEVIFSLATICAAPRSAAGCGRMLEYARALKEKGARAVVRNIRYIPVSSTMVRNAVRQGKSLAGLVPPAVERYIREHHLYLWSEMA